VREHAQHERSLPTVRHGKEERELYGLGGGKARRAREEPSPKRAPEPLWGDPPDYGHGLNVAIHLHPAARLAHARMKRARKRSTRGYDDNPLGSAEYDNDSAQGHRPDADHDYD
jgi:hypothetical protein